MNQIADIEVQALPTIGPADGGRLGTISVTKRLCSVMAALGFWLLLTRLITETNLLKPWFVYQVSGKLAAFVLLNALAALVYAGAQRWITNWSWQRCLTIAAVCMAVLDLWVLYYALEPVMLSELITQHLFYRYMEALHFLMAIIGPAAAGILIARSAYVLQSGVPSRSASLLPVALGISLSGQLLVPTLAASVVACLATLVKDRPLCMTVRRSARAVANGITAALSSDRFVVWAGFLVAFAIRAVYAVRTAISEQSNGFVWDDAAIYEQGARDLSYEGYSLFLRAIYALTGHSFIAVRLVQALLAACVCVLIFRLAALIAGRQVALIAIFLSIWNGVLISIPALQARETLLTFLLLVGVYYPLKWRRTSLRRDVAGGVIFGLLGLVKVIAAPVVFIVAWFKQPAGTQRLRHVAVMGATAMVLVGTKSMVNRPLNVPVGRTGGEYAAMAYFAGNHPFASEDQWFNLTPEQYGQLRQMGFNVGSGAGEPDVVAAWKARYPRIAYCDPVTFETNTAQLVRYNLAHPLRLAQITAENFTAFFLGKMHHHRKFDTIHLLNESAYSALSRIFWLALVIPGWMYAWSKSASAPQSREALIVSGATIGYFTVVYTIMIGTTIYSIPLVPYLIVLQSAGLRWIGQTLRQDTAA